MSKLETNPAENLEPKVLSYETFKAAHSSKDLTQEEFSNIANFIPQTRATIPGFSTGFTPGGKIGTILAPEIVASPSGTELASFPMFNKEGFGDDSGSDVVAINSGTKEADLSITWSTVSLQAHARKAYVDVRLQNAMAASGIDLASSAVDLVRNLVENGKEKAIATLFRTAGSYTNASQKVTLAGATQWSHASGVPMTNIFAGIEVVRGFTGMRPNYLWLSPRAFQALRTNAQITDLMKYGGTPTNLGAPASVEALQGLFGLNVVIGDNITTATENGAFGDSWGTDAGLACVGNNNLASPKFAATFVSAGSPIVLPPYLSMDRGVQGSQVYTYIDYYTPTITMATAGFWWKDASA